MVSILLAAVVLVAAVFDLRFRKIPNWLTAPAVAVGLLFHVVLSGGEGAASSMEGFGVAMLVYVPLYLLRGMGAGDVKLMAAVGAIVGPGNWISIFIVTSLLGGVAALAMVIVQGRFYETWFNVQSLIGSLLKFRAPWTNNSGLDVRNRHAARLPHGAVIAGGALLCTALGYLV